MDVGVEFGKGGTLLIGSGDDANCGVGGTLLNGGGDEASCGVGGTLLNGGGDDAINGDCNGALDGDCIIWGDSFGLLSANGDEELTDEPIGGGEADEGESRSIAGFEARPIPRKGRFNLILGTSPLAFDCKI